MPTLLLTFANSETNRLKTLTDEYEGVSDALRNREIQGDFTVVSKPMATRSQIQSEIRAREEDLCLFLYSGHAGRDRLQLEDGVGHSEGIAALLGRCPILKVVILNGCSTAEQVKWLLEQKIPIVVATSAPVQDWMATQFSIALFRELSQHKLPIKEAFDRAVNAAQVYGQLPKVDRGKRGLDFSDGDTPVWGIYYKPENETLVGVWQLPTRGQSGSSPSVPTKKEIQGLVAKNKLEVAIEKLTTIDLVADKAREQMAALTDLESREMSNIIRFDDATIQRAKIVNVVLKLANQLD